MSVLLQVKNLHKSYGALTILDDASASFSRHQKIGVIGRNGAGKSTLCKIITGEEQQDSGTISRNADLKLSYLEQHDPFKQEESVVSFLARYTEREPWQCAEIAGKFQLKNELLDAKIGTLAGGYQTRVKLAAMLLREPNFLILDEPSNYLDLSTLILLENFLQEFRGGYLVVSHDREFLKRTCEHTLEIEQGALSLYPGNIEQYFEFKEEQRANKIAYNKQVEKKKAKLQAFVERFRAKASTASRAKSKLKQMHKLTTIEIAHALSTVRIRIPDVERKAGIALVCDDLAIGYPEKEVASHVSLTVDRGAHVAVLGDNGQGKTTFLRTISSNLKKKGGTFKWGSGLKLAHYAQHVLKMLHPEDDVFTHLQREAAHGVTRQDVLNMAGCFLFKGDDVKKKVSVLSGGERARLCLAGLLLTRSHVLLLDEPTNHLDFETVEALASALKKFHGTIFFISHDRTFVNLIASNILDVKDGRISRYPGTYEDYVDFLERRARDEDVEDIPAVRIKAAPKKQAEPVKKEPTPDYLERKRIKSEINKIKSKVKKVERRISERTKERDRMLEEMKKNPFHFSKDRNARLKELHVLLEEDEAEWTKLAEGLERLK